jgi:hypothetical protein
MPRLSVAKLLCGLRKSAQLCGRSLGVGYRPLGECPEITIGIQVNTLRRDQTHQLTHAGLIRLSHHGPNSL